MTTEQKIRKAFESQYGTPNDVMCEVTYWDQFEHFKAGYLALLNSLELSAFVGDGLKLIFPEELENMRRHEPGMATLYNTQLYALPEGVEK